MFLILKYKSLLHKIKDKTNAKVKELINVESFKIINHQKTITTVIHHIGMM